MSERIVWHGNEDLRGLLVPLGELHLDPANTNTHPDENVESIAASYARFGQGKPVVADRAGVVRDGNGQLMACRLLGWTHMAVSRSDLSGVDLVAYGIAANRTAETSKRDPVALAAALEAILSEPGYPIESTGYTEEQVQEMLAGAADEQLDDGDADQEVLPEKWMVVVECASERQQVELLGRFQSEGLACKAIVA